MCADSRQRVCEKSGGTWPALCFTDGIILGLVQSRFINGPRVGLLVGWPQFAVWPLGGYAPAAPAACKERQTGEKARLLVCLCVCSC